MKVILKKSNRKNKKYSAILFNNKKIKTLHFGQYGASDYTRHKDDERKERYIKRHKKRENWNELNPGSFSRWILWNKKTLSASIKDMEKRFNINIVNKI